MDLSTQYLGLPLRNPVIAGASPLSRDVSTVRRMEDAGVAAVVLFSLFEEEIHHGELTNEHYAGVSDEGHSLAGFPDHDRYGTSPEQYVRHIERLKEAVDIPIIGSLNGATPGGWVECARQICDAGADALELNIYHVATDPEESGQDVEDRILDILVQVLSAVDVPVSVKLSPYLSALSHFAGQLDREGARGLVLFNRFYQPDIDLESLEVTPRVVLSTPGDLRLPLRWIGILHGQVRAHLAASGGVHSHEDVLKALLAGAQVAMMVSALLERGVEHAHEVLWKLEAWLEEHDVESVDRMRGTRSHLRIDDPAAFERAHYVRGLETFL